MADMNVTRLEIEQATCILEQIANQAALIDRVCYHYGHDDDRGSQLELAIMLRNQIAQLGALADMGVKKLGGIQVTTIEGWLLPPIYPTEEENLVESFRHSKDSGH